MPEDRVKLWDQRHAVATRPAPAEVLLRHARWLPARGRALDLACGLGANALFLAEHGLDAHGWDRSTVALDRLSDEAQRRGLRVAVQQQDVIADPPRPSTWDVIVCTRFLHRPLCRELVAALRPGGVLFVQTFTRLGRVGGGPTNPDFLLEPAELLALFDGLTVLAAMDGSAPAVVQPDSESVVAGQAWLVGRRASSDDGEL